MDRNTLLGLLMMGAVIFGFMYLNKPSDEEIARQQRERQEQIDRELAKAAASGQQAAAVVDTITAAEASQIVPMVKEYGTAGADGTVSYTNSRIALSVSPEGGLTGHVKANGHEVDINKVVSNSREGLTPEMADEAVASLRAAMGEVQKYKSFARYVGGENREITVENDLMAVTFSSLGGKVSKVVLKKYKTERTTPASDIVLFDGDTNSYSFTFTPTGRRYETADFNFNPVQVNDSVVEMRLDLAADAALGIRYTVHPEDYIVSMEIFQNGMDKVFAANLSSAEFSWHQKMGRNEKGRTFEERNSGIFYKYLADSPDELGANSDERDDLRERVKWVAFKNQFFSGVVIPRTYFNSAELKSIVLKDNPDFLKDLSMHATFDYSVADGEPVAFDFYFGPNDYPLLSSLDDKINKEEDLEMTRLVPLGWGLFRYINKWIVIPVFSFLGQYITNYGVIILLLTIFIKIILFPFTYKSYMSQAKMRVLAPEIKELNDKYPGKENAMVRQQKTMEIYNRAGASPFSGCLPMLLQAPVLVAMFSFFPSAIELRGESFLWAKDLSAPDVIFELPFTIPFYGKGVSLFCLLMTVTNIIYTRINMQNQPGGNSMPGMKWMMYLMPVMFLFFFNDYASGLSYYYFLSLLITIVQTYIFRRVVDEKKVRAQMLANSKKPKKKSGFMARLEEAQRKQQAMLREQQKQKGGRR